ncbi:polymorphic toxin-type HINT domain-containing protein [Planctomycetota bacterium]|nr:polymorphic toxin-type HINT domain-containing protein [Planctomycetota bacterium]
MTTADVAEPHTNQQVYALLLLGNYLYVGGRFTYIYNSDANPSSQNPNPIAASNFALIRYTTAGTAINANLIAGFTGVGRHEVINGQTTVVESFVNAFSASSDGSVVMGGKFNFYGDINTTGQPVSPSSILPLASNQNLLEVADMTFTTSFGVAATLYQNIEEVTALAFQGSGPTEKLYIGQVYSNQTSSIAIGSWNGLYTVNSVGTVDRTVSSLVVSSSGDTVLASLVAAGAVDSSVMRIDTANPTVSVLTNSANDGTNIGAIAITSADEALAIGNFFWFSVSRENLAAYDEATGRILDWRPRANDGQSTDAVVHALDIAASHVFIGGEFPSINENFFPSRPYQNVAAAHLYDPLSANAPDALTSWSTLISTDGPVYALEHSDAEAKLYIGGFYSTANGTFHRSLSAIDPSTGGQWPAFGGNFTVNNGTQSGKVRALSLVGNHLYVGGEFTRYHTTLVSNLMCISADYGAPCPPWKCEVNGVVFALTADEQNNILYIGGDFTQLTNYSASHARTNLAAISTEAVLPPLWGGDVLPNWDADTNGTVRTILLSSAGNLYVGGEFTDIDGVAFKAMALLHTDIQQGTATVETEWKPDLYDPSGIHTFGVLAIHEPAADQLVVGGWLNFVGSDIAGNLTLAQNLFWPVPEAYQIVTTALPSMYSEQQVPSGIFVQLNRSIPTAWSISSVNAPGITIDPQTGEIGGVAPINTGSSPQIVFVTVTATTSSGWFSTVQISISILPALPQSTVTIAGPSSIVEGDDPVLNPTPVWTVAIDQSQIVPVYVDVSYLANGARAGFEISPQINTVVFYPLGMTIPATLPADTLATNGLSIDIPVAIFGDQVYTPGTRKFTIQISSGSTEVQVDAVAFEVEVDIVEDDPTVPVLGAANVLSASVYEDLNTLAQINGVVSNQPFIVWEFGSGIAGELQGSWQVQISNAANYSSIFFDSSETFGGDDHFQLGGLLDGQAYFARVRVWASTGGTPSDWYSVAFHMNTAPSAPTLLDPAGTTQAPGTVISARPTFSWEIADDADGNALYPRLVVEDANLTTKYSVDSRSQNQLFEYLTAAGWVPLSQFGIPSGVLLTGQSNVRIRLLGSMPLTQGIWNWHVLVSDTFESSSSTTETIDVQPQYQISGVYTDGGGIVLPGRTVNAVLMPSMTPISTSPATTGILGEFTINLSYNVPAGEVVAVYVDPDAIDPLSGGPFNEFSSVVTTFPGGDLIDTAGEFRKVSLELGRCELEARYGNELSLINLASFTTVPNGLPFSQAVVGDDNLYLDSRYDELHIDLKLRVKATFAAPNEPRILWLPAAVTTNGSGELSIEDGSEVYIQSLINNGQTTMIDSRLNIEVNSESSGNFSMSDGSYVDLDNCSLTVKGGQFTIDGSIVSGTNPQPGNVELILESGILEVTDGLLVDCTLVIENQAQVPEIDSLVIDMVTPILPPATHRCLHWKRQGGTPATLKNIVFASSTPYNVHAEAGADQVIMVGCGGNIFGESNDLDPADPPSGPGGIVQWQVAEINELAAYSGDQRTLVTWNAGAQAGPGISFEVLSSASAGGPFVAVGTTADSFYIDSSLPNDIEMFYRVRTLGPGSTQPESSIVSSTPRAASIVDNSPAEINDIGTSPASIVGLFTHFDATTTVSTTYSNASVPANSIVILSERVILYDVITASSPEGSMTVDINTPTVWSALVPASYAELLQVAHEVVKLPTLADPTVSFSQSSGGIGTNTETSGQFRVEVVFDDQGGADIDPSALICTMDEDIYVGGVLVPAGTNLAYLWDYVDVNGGYWEVDQVATNATGTEEYVSPGETAVCVCIGNEYGYESQNAIVNFRAEWNNFNWATIDTKLIPGVLNQPFEMTCKSVGNANMVWLLGPTYGISDSQSKVNLININSPLVVNPATNKITGVINVVDNASAGKFSFLVGNSSNPPAVQNGTWQNLDGIGTYFVIDRKVDFTSYLENNSTAVGTVVDLGLGQNGSGTPILPSTRSNYTDFGVRLHNGEYRTSVTDVALRGRAMDIVWDRHYRSSRAEERTILGRGWFNTYTQSLIATNGGTAPSSIIWSGATGELIEFGTTGAPETKPGQLMGSVIYEPESGVQVKAWYRSVSGTDFHEFWIQDVSGNFLIFTDSENVGLHSSNKSYFSLARIEDSYGNRQMLRYSRDGRLISVWSDTSNHLSLRIGYDTSMVSQPGLVNWVRAYSRIAGTVRDVYYRHSQGGFLTLSSEADRSGLNRSSRHGWLWTGYAYLQERDANAQPMGARMLKKIYPPSQTTPMLEPGTNTLPGQQDFWIVDETAIPTPTIEVEYDYENGLRVNEHTMYDTYTHSIEYDNTGASGDVLERTVKLHPSGSGTTLDTQYVLNGIGLAISISTPYEGTSNALTTYEYFPATQAVKSVTYPEGNSEHYEYAAANPLTDFIPKKTTKKAVLGSSLPDMITERVVSDSVVLLQGRYMVSVTETIDPWGNRTTVETKTGGTRKPSDDWSVQTTTTSKYRKAVGAVGSSVLNDVAQVSQVDGHGRPLRDIFGSGTDQSITTYTYLASVNSGSAEEGQLHTVAVEVMGGANGQGATNTSTYSYNAYGDVETVSPEGFATGYGSGDHETVYHTNGLGQIYRVEYPVVGSGISAGFRPETWIYYDKDGRVTREISRYVPEEVTTLASVSATGNETDAELDTKFPRPVTLTADGWVHTKYEYNVLGQLVKVHQDIDLNGTGGVVVAVTERTYDDFGRLKAIIDAEGRTVTNEYYVSGLLRKQTNATGTSESTSYDYSYDKNRNLLTEGFAGQVVTKYGYDGHGRRNSVESPTVEGKLRAHTTFSEHSSDPSSQTSPLTQYTETSLSNQPSGDPSANPVFTATARKFWTEYDSFSRGIRIAQIARDTAGVELPRSKNLSYAGENGDLPLSIVAQQYDFRGGITKSFESSGSTTTESEYDSRGRITNSSGYNGTAESTFKYNKANLTSMASTPLYGDNGSSVDVHMKLTDFHYDPSGNMVKSVENISTPAIVTYQYNTLGFLEKTTDGNDRIAEYDYNLVGWVRNARTGKSGSLIETETAYDKTGLVVSQTANRGQEEQTTTYTYDGAGRQKTMTRPGMGEYEYYYDDFGRMTIEHRKKENVAVVTEYGTGGVVLSVKAFESATINAANSSASGTAIGAEVYEYNTFGETTKATSYSSTIVSNNKTSELTMEYNTLGLIEKQDLVVYQNGVPISVDVYDSHPFHFADLRFDSKYVDTVTAPSGKLWTMKATYDADGRERSLTYWDERKTESNYKFGLLQTVFENSPSTIILASHYFEQGFLSSRIHGNDPRTTFPSAEFGYSFTSFLQSDRGELSKLAHGYSIGVTQSDSFAANEVVRDFTGNSIIDRTARHSGLVRLREYDSQSRLTKTWTGAVDPHGFETGTVHSVSTSSLTFDTNSTYAHDDVDNITSVIDDLGTKTFNVGAETGNQIESTTLQSATDTYAYDNASRISHDPATGLDYEYNYRGQTLRVKSGESVIRSFSYDAFGRKVLQLEAPGTEEQQGTIYIPNIGFGGNGQGADYAGEVSFTKFILDLNEGREVVQYTYGIGATGNGFGRKRVAEFVAFRGADLRPHYRFLHENILGSTIATTNRNGDRTHEYDYTEYGVPLDAPILVDSRHFANITPHPVHSDVSIVSHSFESPAAGKIPGHLQANRLIGCELRVYEAKLNGPGEYHAAPVIGQKLAEIHIHDPGNTIATLWAAPALPQIDPRFGGVYDLSQGYREGVIDGVDNPTNDPQLPPDGELETGEWVGGNWGIWDPQTMTFVSGEKCTFIPVNVNPFQPWMYSVKDNSALDVWVTFFDGTNELTVLVLGVDTPNPTNTAYKELVVKGDNLPTWVKRGAWYRFDSHFSIAGELMPVAQSGVWHTDSTTSVFDLEPSVALSPNMVGWYLQPDINLQVYLPIVAVDHVLNQVTTLPSNFITPGKKGESFRIFAPPGVVRNRAESGTLSRYNTPEAMSSADTTKCLFAGYDLETPLAGLWDTQNSSLNLTEAKYRQTGSNFAGMYYTLHRRYDPILMRFTTPDPLASPFYNLFGYAGNNPATYYDPDGLEDSSNWYYGHDSIIQGIWSFLGIGQAGAETNRAINQWGADTVETYSTFYGSTDGIKGLVGTISSNVDRYSEEGVGSYASDVRTSGAGALAGTADSISPYLGNLVADGLSGAGIDTKSQYFNYGRVVGNVGASILAMAATGGCSAWAKGAGVALTAIDLGHIGYAASTGDWTTAIVSGIGQLAGFGFSRIGGRAKCFVEGTQVKAADANGDAISKNIEDIEVGDLVWARDEATGEEGFKEVVQLFRNETDRLVHVSYETSSGSETLVGTPEHPFWSLTRSTWVGMGDLNVGEQLSLTSGSTATVTTVWTEELAEPATVCNFEVADWHTYYVGTESIGWVWTHNRCDVGSTYDAQGRLTKARANVTRADLGTGTSTNAASRAYARSLGNANDDAGHLIAKNLGGPGGKNSGNIVPQDPRINRGEFAQFEGEVAGLIQQHGSAFIRVMPRYKGNSTRPFRIDYQVRVGGRSIRQRFRNP